MDELDRQEGLEEPEEALVSTEPVDRDSHVAVIHDSFGERYVNVALMLERAPTVSVLRVLGASGALGQAVEFYGPAIDALDLHPSLRPHNHSPGLAVLPNGDVLMAMFTSYHEYEPGVSLIASRLRDLLLLLVDGLDVVGATLLGAVRQGAPHGGHLLEVRSHG